MALFLHADAIAEERGGDRASAAAVLQTAALIAGCLATAITRKKEEQDEQLIAGYSSIFSVQRSSLLTLVSFPHKVLLPL
ncbi:hypothetical protein ZIOFF_011838 [Zingiber officinale]|uniref:Uncharacterized protein n=1 Tax=Zingiber officinale TaxID=94328 RepID=A0A8J5I6I0_ZINOF|nr:hypothetical protein ZIOFF_011838 [Zingiber officinale]